MRKVPLSVRISPTAKSLLEKLAVKLGISQVGVLELALRKLAQQENVEESEAVKNE